MATGHNVRPMVEETSVSAKEWDGSGSYAEDPECQKHPLACRDREDDEDHSRRSHNGEQRPGRLALRRSPARSMLWSCH